ncbi:MAG: hypothetical protein OXH09_01150 [Gammaproteobacteria bacterium]|nr:hypothetical protein [Gammaproteobacteria bacterium]
MAREGERIETAGVGHAFATPARRFRDPDAVLTGFHVQITC